MTTSQTQSHALVEMEIDPFGSLLILAADSDIGIFAVTALGEMDECCEHCGNAGSCASWSLRSWRSRRGARAVFSGDIDTANAVLCPNDQISQADAELPEGMSLTSVDCSAQADLIVCGVAIELGSEAVSENITFETVDDLLCIGGAAEID